MSLKKLLVVLLAVIMCFAFVGCGGNDDPAPAPAPGADGGDKAAAGDAPASIKIGIPNPTTGAIASFGIGSPWAEELAIETVNADGGVYLSAYDAKVPVELFIVDTESNPTKASEVTQMLIQQNEVDLLIARHTPDTALPVSAMAERFGIPCISMECPVEAWQAGGPYEWVYHSFWSIETCFEVYKSMWDALGYDPADTVVGYLFPNDADGLAWEPIFTDLCNKYGYTISDPGKYPIMNQDWTAVVSQFKNDGVTVVTGNDIAPDFSAFVAQAAQQGLKYEVVSLGRGFLFPADANALDLSIANGLTCEIWWSPWHPFNSSITGQTCEELAGLYEEATGNPWSAPMGYKYAGIELALNVLERAGSLDADALVAAIGATDMDTVVGPIKYDAETHVSYTTLVGGQWQLNEAGDAVEIKCVTNHLYPEIPQNGEIFQPAW